MKKNYIQPNTEIININMPTLMAASINFNDNDGTGSGNLNDDYADGDALSKWAGSDLWD